MTSLFNVFNIDVFQNVSILQFILLLLLYFLANAVRGFFGIGALPLLLLLSVWILEPHHAVLLAMLVITYTQVMFVTEAFRHGNWRLCLLLAFGYIPTVALGVAVFTKLDQSWLGIVVGGLLVGVILADIIIPSDRLRNFSKKFPRLGAISMAAVAGGLSGLIGAGNLIFLSLYIKTIYQDARLFRATMLLIAIMMGMWRLCVQSLHGMITASLLIESVIVTPAALLGSYLGIRLFKNTPSAEYFGAFRLLLIFLSVLIVIRHMLAIF